MTRNLWRPAGTECRVSGAEGCDSDVMNVVQPVWTLHRDCPFCGEPALELIACSACQHVAVICGEEGSLYPDPHDLSRSMNQTDPCPGCGAYAEYGAATSAQIQAAGFTASDYE